MNNRERLIETAAELFYRQGFQATTVEDVLAATGVARSNFYYHFANKLELARDVVRHWIAAYDHDLVEPTLGEPSLSPGERLRLLFGRVDGSQDCAAGHIGCPLGTLAIELAQHDEEVQNVLSDYFTHLQQLLTKTIADGVARGEFQPTSPPEAAQVALSVLEGALLLTRTHQRSGRVWRAGLALVALLETGEAGVVYN